VPTNRRNGQGDAGDRELIGLECRVMRAWTLSSLPRADRSRLHRPGDERVVPKVRRTGKTAPLRCDRGRATPAAPRSRRAARRRSRPRGRARRGDPVGGYLPCDLSIRRSISARAKRASVNGAPSRAARPRAQGRDRRGRSRAEQDAGAVVAESRAPASRCVGPHDCASSRERGRRPVTSRRSAAPRTRAARARSLDQAHTATRSVVSSKAALFLVAKISSSQ